MSSPADWYPDPAGRHEVRYWDGTTWTEHVSDRGVAGRDPVDDGRPAEALQAEQEFDAWRETSDQRTRATTDRPQEATAPARPPTPIITEAGPSSRTKLLMAFVAIDVAIAAVVIWFVAR